MTLLLQRLAWHLRLATQRWRASAFRIVDVDGNELHWDRCDDFTAARAAAVGLLRAGSVAFAWQPAARRRTVIVAHPGQLRRARELAREAGWLPLLTRFEMDGMPVGRRDTRSHPIRGVL